MKTTPAMIARTRELARGERDDYDRAILAALDDLEVLQRELATAYRAVQAYEHARREGKPMASTQLAYHALTIAAARRFIQTQELDGTDYFIGLPIDVLHRWLSDEGDIQ